jgi:hypothetical protein
MVAVAPEPVAASGAKADLARRALHAAEAKTGVASQTVRSLDVRPPKPAAAQPADAGTAGIGIAAAPPAPATATPTWTSRALAQQVAGRLTPGSTVSVEGSTSVLLAVAAACWGPGRWGALAGLPDIGLLAARQAGIPLDRCLVVPDLGPEPLRVLAALVDSHAVVVTGPLAMAAGDRRRIEARVRHRRMNLIAGGAWPGARLAIEVDQVVWDGIGQGSGTLVEALVAARLGSRLDELWGRAG